MKQYDDDFDAENDFITDRDLGDENDFDPDFDDPWEPFWTDDELDWDDDEKDEDDS